MGFAFVGLGIWILFVYKMHWKEIAILCFFALVAIGLSVVVDHWYYGVWVFTPYNYFDVNIIRNVAAKFGVKPWWYYFVLFFNFGAPPISLILMVLFFIGVWKRPLDLFPLVCVTFFIGHFLIGHKELRFLFPSSFAFIFVSCQGLDYCMQRFTVKRGWNIIFRLLIIADFGILLFKLFTPAEEVIKYYGFIYDYAQKQKTTIISFNRSPYRMDTIESNFYKPRDLNIEILHHPAEMANVFRRDSGRVFIHLSSSTVPGTEFSGLKTERIYCQFPDWLLKYNFNNWQERSYIWTVFRVYPATDSSSLKTDYR